MSVPFRGSEYVQEKCLRLLGSETRSEYGNQGQTLIYALHRQADTPRVVIQCRPISMLRFDLTIRTFPNVRVDDVGRERLPQENGYVRDRPESAGRTVHKSSGTEDGLEGRHRTMHHGGCSSRHPKRCPQLEKAFPPPGSYHPP
jgi:hypothetical protein